MAKIDLKDATIKILDGGTGTGQESITVKLGDGNLTWSRRRNMEYIMDGGNLDGVREGDQEPVELSLDAVWEFITASTGNTPTIEDALTQSGEASSWVSSGADDCEPYAVDIEITYNPNCGSVGTETITFSEFRYEQIDHDLRAGTFAISGRCNEVAPSPVHS